MVTVARCYAKRLLDEGFDKLLSRILTDGPTAQGRLRPEESRVVVEVFFEGQDSDFEGHRTH